MIMAKLKNSEGTEIFVVPAWSVYYRSVGRDARDDRRRY
ncbi:Uncharacterised protein [Citrobacter freundii]|nr:Uncharacterised protein [Citrobacter freundii]